MKLVLSTIVGAIVLFFLGWIIYGLIFGGFMEDNFGKIMRGPGDYKLWAMIVASILQAFFLAWIYPKGYKGGSPAKEGFMYGIYMGLLLAAPYIFYVWAQYPIKWGAALLDGVLWCILIFITCFVIGLVYGKIGEKKEAAG